MARASRSRVRLAVWPFLAALLAASLGSVGLAGCEGTSIGNPPGVVLSDIQLGLQGTAGLAARGGELPDAGAADSERGPQLDEVWLAFAEASLLAAGHCGAGGGPALPDDVPAFAAELVSGKVLPARPTWSRPGDETYCQLRTRLDGASAAIEGVPAELAGVTLYAKGQRKDGVPFVARVSVPAEIARGPQTGTFSLGAGPVGMVLVFDFDDWFEKLALDAATVEAGRILIDDTHNVALAKAVAAAVPPSARLFRDGDRNGRYEAGAGNEQLGP